MAKKSSKNTSRTERPDAMRRARGMLRHGPAIAVVTFFFAMTVLILLPVPFGMESTVRTVAGDATIALKEVRAPSRIEVDDTERKQQEQLAIEFNHPRIWIYRRNVKTEAKKNLGEAMRVLSATRPRTGSDVSDIATEIFDNTKIALTNEDVDFLSSGVNLNRFRKELVICLDRTLGEYFIVTSEGQYNAQHNARVLELEGVPSELAAAVYEVPVLEWPTRVRTHLQEVELRSFYPSARDRRIVEVGSRILMDLIGPTLEYDSALTEAKKAQLSAELARRKYVIAYEAGELIAREGENNLSPTQRAAIDEVENLERKAYPFKVLGLALFTATAFIAVGVYLARFRSDLAFVTANINLLCVPMILALGFGRILFLALPETEFGYATALFPSALVGMIASILIGPVAGFSLVIATVVLFSVGMNLGVDFLVYSLLGGLTAVFSLKTFRKRLDVLRGGIRVGLVNMAMIFFLGLFHIPPEFDETLLLLGIFNGLFYGAITLPTMLLFERFGDIVTDMGLLELTSPDNELLRMIEEKAPGSYQHSLSVTKLAESAAEAIGANFLLVRAGAYFHDIGKSVKPNYFSENQVTLDDKKAHSKISPYMSVLIIKNHVKEGIEIAKRAGLPSKVVDFIPQHHGTSLIKYFHTEALRRYEESESLDPVREEDFRYPGPKPQSIETAIVLLADSVEAIATATLTSAQVNENDIRRLVERAVTERFEDGQFDECDLTMRDLYLIKESFVRTLKSRFHHRISYPATSKKDAAREVRDAPPSTAVSAGISV